MTEDKTNSLADFLNRHRDNPNLLEGVVDAVEIRKSIYDGPIDDSRCVTFFRVNPNIRNPQGDRRYFFILPYANLNVMGPLPQCELVVGDEVKIFFEYDSQNKYHNIKELANITTGRVYKNFCAKEILENLEALAKLDNE